MSEYFQLLHRAIQSYDESEVQAVVARIAQTARQEQQPCERLIVELKTAVNALPATTLRERARSELRDSVVRMAIAAYYDGNESYEPRFVERERHSSF